LFCEFEQAVSHADAGRVLRVLKFWSLAFRGAGQHNYARECVEILIKWNHEMTDALRRAHEKAWFFNRYGRVGGWIGADLYLEQCNYWVKVVFIIHLALQYLLTGTHQQVFIAQGSGVTVEYIITKGSACVEAFRTISHDVARYFGDSDRSRRHKEVKFFEDMRVLVDDMELKNIHVATPGRFVPGPSRKEDGVTVVPSAIFDVMVAGAEVWQNGKFQEYIRATTYDPALGYPISDLHMTPDEVQERLRTDTVFDDVENPLAYDALEDLDDGDISSSYPGMNGIGDTHE